jgi:hypothetical protein
MPLMPSLAKLFTRPSLADLEKHGPDTATPGTQSDKSPIPPQPIARVEQEQLVCATLGRFAQVPVSAIFVYVHHSRRVVLFISSPSLPPL